MSPSPQLRLTTIKSKSSAAYKRHVFVLADDGAWNQRRLRRPRGGRQVHGERGQRHAPRHFSQFNRRRGRVLHRHAAVAQTSAASVVCRYRHHVGDVINTAAAAMPTVVDDNFRLVVSSRRWRRQRSKWRLSEQRQSAVVDINVEHASSAAADLVRQCIASLLVGTRRRSDGPLVTCLRWWIGDVNAAVVPSAAT